MTDEAFHLHPQLAADTALVGDWELCRVLLMNDCRFPWLVLVPRVAGLVELFDLDEDAAATVLQEITRAGRALKTWTRADKVNIGALGNQVPQLHIHVVARRIGDAAWPNPVWGAGTPKPYADLNQAAARIAAAL